MMVEYINSLEKSFISNANHSIATGQIAYMKDKFKFLGIPSPLRRSLQKPLLEKKNLPPKSFVKDLVIQLWNKEHREYHYFALEFASKYAHSFTDKDLELFEWMVLHNSWWDSVDFIAPKLIGSYFISNPQLIEKYIHKWLLSENIWLQRTCLLFQLHYKASTDVILLARIIEELSISKEFFIKKAIGWILREYSKTNPIWVIDFVEKTTISNLSKKEGLKIIYK